MRTHSGPRALAVLAVLAVVASACGGAAQPAPTTAPAAAATPAAAPAPKPGELDRATIDAANKEGQVVWYTSMNIEDATYVLGKFQERNGGIKVELVRASGEKLLARFVTEAQAGKVLADVVETGGVDIAGPIKQGLAQEFRPPHADKFPDDLRDVKSGLWTSTRLGVETIAWNTNELQKLGLTPPTSFDDLGDPKWKGQFLLERDDVEILLALAKLKYKDDAKAREVFEKIAANEPRLSKGHSETTDLLIAGERAAFFGAHGHRTEALKNKGAPIDWMRTEAVVTIDGAFLAKGAPHPNAGKVYINWLVSEEGQKAIADRQRVPARPGSADPKLYPDKRYVSGPDFADDFKKYQEMWQKVFRIR